MEEKKESTQNNSEEIKLLTFQPEQMVNEIEKLKAELSSVQMNNGYLSMINTDLTIEIERLRKRSLKSTVQEFLLRILGGLWEEGK
jgi:regulator of replication initiation timing